MKIATILVCLLGACLGFDDKTILQELAVDARFSILANAINTAGLDIALSTKGPFTLFAPTNTAFNKLDSNTLNNLLNNPTQLADVLKYHVLREFVVSAMISGDTRKDTLYGVQLDIAPSNGGLILNSNARVDSLNKDMVVNNGVIQPIDNVIMPSSSPKPTQNLPITQFIMQDGRFHILKSILNATNMLFTLADTDRSYTFFAPTDKAFEAFRAYLDLSWTGDGLPAVLNVGDVLLKYHTVQGVHKASQLVNGETLNTLYGTETLKVNVLATGLTINNNAHVIYPDLICSNGVVQAIDALLLPQNSVDLAGAINSAIFG